MTVSISPIPNFNMIPLKTATQAIYDKIIPSCEENNVKLSHYGNHTGIGALVSLEAYNRGKLAHELFHVDRIQKAFTCLDEVMSDIKESISSCELQDIIQNRQGEYITNGDCIAAMLMKGYIADFRSKFASKARLNVDCEFNKSHLSV